MHSVKLLVFLLGIFISSASEIVSKIEYDHEIRKIYEKLEILDELWKENKILKENIQSLQKENVEFQDAIVTLESDVDRLRKEILELNSKGTVHNSLNSKIEENPNAEFFNATEQRRISELLYKGKSDYEGNEHTSSSLEKVRRGIVTSNQNSIGFLAYNPNHQRNLGIRQTVEFPIALTNIGSAYNPSSSIFRAPVDGLYYFSVTILSFRGEDIEVEIVLNGNGMVYTYSGGESMHGSGSTSAVLQLHANDDVWIRILDVRIVNDVRRGIVPTNQNNIGFLAYNSNDQQNLGIHQTLEFPTALTNVGSAYSTLHSIFRAPVDGLYFFSVTILSFRGEDMEVEIVHNGNGMAYIYSGGESMHGSGSTSAVLNLHANDDVWIRILDNKAVNDGNIRVHGYKWSSFCGFKIV